MASEVYRIRTKPVTSPRNQADGIMRPVCSLQCLRAQVGPSPLKLNKAYLKFIVIQLEISTSDFMTIPVQEQFNQSGEHRFKLPVGSLARIDITSLASSWQPHRPAFIDCAHENNTLEHWSNTVTSPRACPFLVPQHFKLSPHLGRSLHWRSVPMLGDKPINSIGHLSYLYGVVQPLS